MLGPRVTPATCFSGGDLFGYGSFPLTRGARDALNVVHNEGGLIPAYAGRTVGGRYIWCCRRAHPRLRGAHRDAAARPQNRRGSSPLTRGALLGVDHWEAFDGLIPAYAGRTPRKPGQALPGWAHPRLRGAHAKSRSSCPVSSGLIPAYAGRTCVEAVEFDEVGAHPRLRGAHFICSTLHICAAGSSPLTRGALAILANRDRADGLIPAYAGRTQTPSHCAGGFLAHPRLRGAHSSASSRVMTS